MQATGLVEGPLPAWSYALAATVSLLVAVATWRSIDAAVVDLVLGVDDQQIAAIEQDVAMELGAEQYLAELAVTTRALLRVPSVTVDILPLVEDGHDDGDQVPGSATWSGQLTATAGTDGTPRRLTRPARHGARELGVVVVGGR